MKVYRKISSFLLISSTALFVFFFLESNDKTPPWKLGKNIAGARRALDQIDAARSYPNRTIPKSGIVEGFREMRARQMAKSSAQKAGGSWRALGPRNIGGRTLALAIHPENPDIIFAGSASGGLWKSEKAGVGQNAWEYVPTGFPVLAVADIAISPHDPDIIFLGTGEVYGHPESHPGVSDRRTRGSYGIGILKSTDGGASWSKSLDWTQNQRTGVQKIKVSPENPGAVWAATTEGVFVSENEGGSWRRVLDVVMATDLVIHPEDTNIVIAACGGMGGSGRGIYRTTDGGASWEKADIGAAPQSFQGKAMLAMAKSNPDIIYASIGNNDGRLISSTYKTWLLKSEDSGASWRLVSDLDYSKWQGWYSHCIGVHPENPNEIYLGGTSIHKSLDGGETAALIPRTHADNHDIAFIESQPEIVYFANDGGVWRTTDGGETVEWCSGGLQTTQFYNGFTSAPADSSLAFGGLQDNGSNLFSGSENWRFVSGGDGGWTAINFDNPNQIFTSLQWLTLFRIDLRSGNLTEITPDRKGVINFIAPFVLSPVDSRTIYGGGSHVYKSTDLGDFWEIANNGEELDGNPIIALAASDEQVNTVYAATSPIAGRGNVFRSLDGGDSWANITGNLPDLFPTDIALAPFNDEKIYITFGGFGGAHIYFSENGGDSWSSLDNGLPDAPAWAVTVDPFLTSQIYLGNDLGVFASTDDGATWEPFMEGLPEAVIAMDLSVSISNRSLRVATHGNGVYERPLLSLPLAISWPPPALPSEFVLKQNYPNPFNPTTTIPYFLPNKSHVRLTIFDNLGREIGTLVDENQSTGWREVKWDGRDKNKRPVASGIYFFQLETGFDKFSRRMVLLR